jgi:hypothetical protein
MGAPVDTVQYLMPVAGMLTAFGATMAALFFGIASMIEVMAGPTRRSTRTAGRQASSR